jgi:hypothetical protein
MYPYPRARLDPLVPGLLGGHSQMRGSKRAAPAADPVVSQPADALRAARPGSAALLALDQPSLGWVSCMDGRTAMLSHQDFSPGHGFMSSAMSDVIER